MSMKSHGINQGETSEQLLQDMLKQTPPSHVEVEYIKMEPEGNTLTNEIIMEDSSPVSGDPMMSQSPAAVVHSSCSSISMDEVAEMLS